MSDLRIGTDMPELDRAVKPRLHVPHQAQMLRHGMGVAPGALPGIADGEAATAEQWVQLVDRFDASRFCRDISAPTTPTARLASLTYTAWPRR